MIKRLSIVALALLLIGVIGSIVTVNTQMKQAEILEEKVIESNDFNNIDIYSNNAKVTLLPTNDEQTKVELFGNYLKYKLAADVEDNTLKISVKTKRDKIFSFDIFSKGLSLTVYVPQKVYDNIHVKSNNGQLKITELEGSDIQLETNNGSIYVNSVQGETVLLETDNGRIEAQDVLAKLVKADSNNGRIEMEDVNAEISGKTNNGRISLTTHHLDRPIELHSDNGRIEIQSENKPTNAIFDVKTKNGSVTVFGESDWDTKIGNGENIIKLSSHNGSITISN